MTGWVIVVLVVSAAALGVVGIRRRFVEVTIRGTSMAPTFSGGERILVRRKGVHRLRHGDIVVVRYLHLWLVKRVTAVAGDPLPADVAPAAGMPAGARIPDGRFVVLGDNSEGSLDSRVCGLFDGGSLLGIMVRPRS